MLPLLVLAYCVAHVLLWGAVLGLTRNALTLDGAEQFVWSYSLEAGYWKHPPLPTWIMAGLVALFGPSVALPFIAAQCCVAIALGLLWRLGCEFMSAQQSFVAMLLTSLVTYHHVGAEAYNHTTVLLPFLAATLLASYRAMQTRSFLLWGIAGLFAGLSMLVKYLALFPLAMLGLYFVLDPGCRNWRQWAGATLALAVALAVLLPHLLWLHSHDYAPLRYAQSVAILSPDFASSLMNLGSFLFTQVGRLAPFLLVFWWLSRGNAAGGRREPVGARERRFLVLLGAGPLACMLVYACFTQTQMLSRWGGTAFLLVGWMVVHRLPAATWRTAWKPVAAAHLAMVCVVALLAPWASEKFGGGSRGRFPSTALAGKVDSLWGTYSRGPIPMLVTDTWTGGNVVAHLGSLPVLVDGVARRAPWAPPADVLRCGALVLEDQSPDRPFEPGVAAYLALARQRGEWRLGGDGSPERAPVRIAWGIIPPDPGEDCAAPATASGLLRHRRERTGDRNGTRVAGTGEGAAFWRPGP